MRSKLQEAAPRIQNSRVSLLTAISVYLQYHCSSWISQPTGCTVVRAVSVGIDQYLRCSALFSNVVITMKYKELSPPQSSFFSLSSSPFDHITVTLLHYHTSHYYYHNILYHLPLVQMLGPPSSFPARTKVTK